MRRFILLIGKSPLAIGGLLPNGVIFTKEEAEERINGCKNPEKIEVLEISNKTVELVKSKVSIV